MIVCWAPWYERPCFLCWKTNPRIVSDRKLHKNEFEKIYPNRADSYFGDPWEYDDYELADSGAAPTHWHPLDPLPNSK